MVGSIHKPLSQVGRAIRHFSRGAVALAVLSAPWAGSAALIEQDFLTPGNGLITLDDVTGVRWLDVNVTKGLSYDDVVADVGGWASRGFRHATAEEVCDLFSRYAPSQDPCPDGGSPTFDWTVASDIQRLLGITQFESTPPGEWTLEGWLDDGGDPGRVGQAYVIRVGFYWGTASVETDVSLSSTADPTAGNYLVRAPEPGSALLLALASLVAALSVRADPPRAR